MGQKGFVPLLLDKEQVRNKFLQLLFQAVDGF